MNSKKIEKIIEKCKLGDRKNQLLLFNFYAKKMMGICIRYARCHDDAQDILQEGFIKIFSKIDQFNNQGPFEGWMRKIFVHCALNFYRNLKHSLETSGYENTTLENTAQSEENNALEKLNDDDVIKIMHKLPEKYRMVLNLSCIEGHSHKEIGEMLNIKEGASRLQLHKAKVEFKALCEANNMKLIAK